MVSQVATGIDDGGTVLVTQHNDWWPGEIYIGTNSDIDATTGFMVLPGHGVQMPLDLDQPFYVYNPNGRPVKVSTMVLASGDSGGLI